jgi:DNA-binding MarR family transcriptional regulator
MQRMSDHLRLDDQFCFAVYSTAHALGRAYKPLLGRLGITYPQYLVMLILWETDDQPIGAIGERLGLEYSTLSPLLKRLETSGAIDRVRNPADERQVRVKLTDKGRDMRKTAREFPMAMLKATGLDLPQLQGLRSALVDVRDTLAKGEE